MLDICTDSTSLYCKAVKKKPELLVSGLRPGFGGKGLAVCYKHSPVAFVNVELEF